MKIIDCFIFYNELTLLNYRLNILYDIVDFFIIVEARQTHRGKSKILFYNENKMLFEKFHNKIIHIIVDLPYIHPHVNYKNNKPFQLLNYNQNGDQWLNEAFQRDSIKHGLDKISLNNEDYIIVSDLDEIPNPVVINNIKNNNLNISFSKLILDNYTFNLNLKKNDNWYHSYIMSYKFYNEYITSYNPLLTDKYIYLSKGYFHIFFNNERLFIFVISYISSTSHKASIKSFPSKSFNNIFRI